MCRSPAPALARCAPAWLSAALCRSLPLSASLCPDENGKRLSLYETYRKKAVPKGVPKDVPKVVPIYIRDTLKRNNYGLRASSSSKIDK